MATTVRDILITINDIDRLRDLHRKGSLNADNFDELIDLINDYKEELLTKTVK